MTHQSSEASHAATFTFGLTGTPLTREGFPVQRQQLFTMDLAARGPVGATDIAKAMADGEIIASLFRKHPEDMAAIFNHVVAGRMTEADVIAERLGLSEARFLEQGGGMWMYIALAGAVIFAYAAFSR
jgi:hypothetical protein